MEDNEIISLYFARSEQAIRETQDKYGKMLRSIAFHILSSRADAEECENDTYVKTWNAIPPERPAVFSAFLAKITRNLSLNRYEMSHAQKRGQGEMPVVLDELAEVIPDHPLDERELTDLLNEFLQGLDSETRNIFLRRYWFGDSIREIARISRSSQSRIKMILLRTRNKLKEALEQEGYSI